CTGAPSGGHLQTHVIADRPPFSDERSVDVDAPCREVLSERPGGQGAAELALPTVEVLSRVRVDGLIVAAVALAVAARVPRQSATRAAVLHAWCSHLDGTRGGSLVDAR